MKRSLEIREIRIDDLRGVFILGLEALPRRGTAAAPWSEKDLAGILAADMSLSFVAARKKTIEGFLIGRMDEDTAEIVWIAARGPKTAPVMADLFRTFVEALPPAVLRIRVAIPGTSSELIDFFEKFGFTDSEQVVIMENFFRKNR